MKNLLNELGIILVVCGALCLAVYYFSVQTNALLVASLILQVAGILSYIFLNKVR